MSVRSQEVAKWGLGSGLWPAFLVAGLSASLAALFVYEPRAIMVGLLVMLGLAAVLRFELLVYWFVFSLPWYPLFDPPVRDAYLLLRFVLFFGVSIHLVRRHLSVREWLVGTKTKKALIAFVGIATVSFFRFGVPADVRTYRELALLLSYIMVFYAVEGWIENSAQIDRILKLLMASTIGVSLFGFYQAFDGGYTDLYFRLYPIQKQNIAPWSGRITSILFQFNSLAGYLNLVIPLAIACSVLAKDRVLKFLGMACACVATLALILTQSRGGLAAFAGILVITVWFLVPRLITRIKLIGGGVLACVLFFPLLLNQFGRLQGVLDDPEASSRIYLWAAATSLFTGNPILGIGYGNYRFLFADFAFVPNAVEGSVDAHNIFLQLLSETGIIGFVSFLLLLGSFILLAHKSMRDEAAISRIIAFGVMGAIAGTLIHGMVDYLFGASPQFGALFWIILALGSRALTGTGVKISPRTVTP
jgi:O-antigen ligase